MAKWIFAHLLALILAFAVGVATAAATVTFTVQGSVISAHQVELAGRYYDVTFIDCVEAFQCFRQVPDSLYTFHSQAEASAAASALLKQVVPIAPTVSGGPDGTPDFRGCGSDSSCTILVPFAASDDGALVTAMGVESLSGGVDQLLPSPLQVSHDLSGDPYSTFAWFKAGDEIPGPGPDSDPGVTLGFLNGHVNAAYNVSIGRNVYDVFFTDCVEAYPCSQQVPDSVYSFHSQAEASAAVSALLQQVIPIAPTSPLGSDGAPDFRGCGSDSWCKVFVPFAASGDGALVTAMGVESLIGGIDQLLPTPQQISHDLSGDTYSTFAWFRLKATVPEPTAWGMMIAGLALAGVAMRRRRRGFMHEA